MRITPATLPLLAARVHTGRVVVFDTETTGGAAGDEICQIAAAELKFSGSRSAMSISTSNSSM